VENLLRPDWQRLRQIIDSWMTSHNRSRRSLAKEAGVQASVISRFLGGQTTLEVGSAIKSYQILYQDLSPLDQQVFLEVTGLLPFALTLPDYRFEPYPESFHGALPRPNYGTGVRLILKGIDLVGQLSRQEAISMFYKAETMLGSASSQAAKAVCLAVLQLIELGDYNKAEEELNRIQNTYKTVMDPETEAEFYNVRGWSYYYLGNFTESIKWFEQCLRLSELTGNEHLGESALHFLGRIYSDLGQMADGKQSSESFHKAELQFDKAYQFHLRWGPDSRIAYDLFRKAQLLRVQGKWREAQEDRHKARQLFGWELEVLNIDLEEALLALEDGDTRISKLKAEKALRGWAQVKKTKAMADALRLLGILECIEGRPEKALELYIAALCIHPFEGTLQSRQMWEDVMDIYHSNIVYREGREAGLNLLQKIREKVESRQDYFAYLDEISADRSVDVVHIFNKLGLREPE
jgi:tetratricopeptide (TPR) repeat protein